MKTRKNIMLYAREVQPTHERLAADSPFGYLKGKENIEFVSRLACGYSTYFSGSGGLQVENDSAFCVQNATVGRVYALAVTFEVYKSIHKPENYPSFIKDKIKEAEAKSEAWGYEGLQETTYTPRQYQYELKPSDFEIVGVVEQAKSKVCVTLNKDCESKALATSLITEVERAFFEEKISIVNASAGASVAIEKDSALVTEGLFAVPRKVSMHASGSLQTSKLPICINAEEDSTVNDQTDKMRFMF